jgi:hypothetical protein
MKVFRAAQLSASNDGRTLFKKEFCLSRRGRWSRKGRAGGRSVQALMKGIRQIPEHEGLGQHHADAAF